MSDVAIDSHVVKILDGLAQFGGLKGVDIANFADVSKATVSRWSNSQKSPHPKTQLVLSNLHYIVMRLSEYYSADEIRLWLYAMHPQLDGGRPIDFVHDGQSELVLDIINRLDDDVYL